MLPVNMIGSSDNLQSANKEKYVWSVSEQKWICSQDGLSTDREVAGMTLDTDAMGQDLIQVADQVFMATRPVTLLSRWTNCKHCK